jgi:ribosome-associated translation inhibitor RaiA
MCKVFVIIHGQGFSVTPALAEHMRRRLGFVLTRHSDRVRRVAIRVGDENGPRGGVDKYCRIQVHLLDAPVAVIKDVGAELYTVIDRAADRVGRVVVKHLDRTHPTRNGARQGARPGRNRWESLQSGHAQGDMA